jgi:hypothetical protein
MRALRPVLERFEEKVERVTDSGCWVWMGALSIGGYGKFLVDGRLIYVHRFTYETWRGPIPAGLVLDHVCRVRCCCSPWHVRAVTQRENAVHNSLSMAAVHSAKDRCGKCGGEYAMRKDRNARRCPRCEAQKCLSYRQRNLERLRAYDRERNKAGRRQAQPTTSEGAESHGN